MAPTDARDATSTTGRRERLRRATFRELDQAAIAEVQEHGAVALSLRRVARRMDMSPAGLYRYVDSREALLTRLIAEGYHDLADHLTVATGGRPRPRGEVDRPQPRPSTAVAATAVPGDRLRAAALTYREWAVTHPHEFGLLFGDPIPGYDAPAGGVTVAAMERVGSALGAPLVDAWAEGLLRAPTAPLETSLAEQLAPMAGVAGREVSPELSFTLLSTWGRLHGTVSLEVFGHHTWLFPDGCEPLYRLEVERLLADLLPD